MLTVPVTRRSVLAGTAAALVASRVRAAAPPVLRIGTLPFGAVHWEIAAILERGLDKAAGVTLENVPLASEAARIGFLSGSVDTIMTDLLFAARLRSEGKLAKFLPYSTAEGSLVVKAGSPIRAISDLRGKSIGVAGGPLDKNWLLLRAAAKTQGLDLASGDAKPVFGAPPLLSLKVENGEVDAGLLYWTYAARLEAADYRTVVSVEQIANMLGAKGSIAFGGFVFKDSVPMSTVAAFAKVLRQGDSMLADDPAVWTQVRPLMKAPEEKTFEALKAGFIRGIPRKPLDVEIAEAKAFYALLAAIGGPALVGGATTLPDGLYVDQKVYG